MGPWTSPRSRRCRVAGRVRRSWPRRRGSGRWCGSTPARARGPAAAEVDAAVLRLVRGLVPVPEVLEVRRADPPSRPALLVTSYLPGVRGDELLPTLGPTAAVAAGRDRSGTCSADLGGMPMPRTGRSSTPTCASAPWSLPDGLPGFVETRRPARAPGPRRVRRPRRGGRAGAGPARQPSSGCAWCTATSTPRTCSSTREPWRSPGCSTGSSRTPGIRSPTSATCCASTASRPSSTPSWSLRAGRAGLLPTRAGAGPGRRPVRVGRPGARAAARTRWPHGADRLCCRAHRARARSRLHPAARLRRPGWTSLTEPRSLWVPGVCAPSRTEWTLARY